MSEKTNKYWLYVLKCEHKKYYVGLTTRTPEIRMSQHARGTYSAARWTQIHRPIAIFDKKFLGSLTKAKAEKYENKVVRKYISKYGINNVRGGDITDPSSTLIRFGRIITRYDYEPITVILLLSIIILVITILNTR